MEADVTRALDLLGLAIVALEADRHDAGVVQVYFDALRDRLREERTARDEAWTLVSQQVTRLLHPALDSQTVNEVGATISRVADAMLADEPLPEDVAALLPSEPEQDGDLMHRDGTPVMKVQPSLDAMGGPLDVDEDEEEEPVPVYPTEKPPYEPMPLPLKGEMGPPTHHVAGVPRRCETRWGSFAAHHIHGCTRQMNHPGPHTCACGANFTLSP